MVWIKLGILIIGFVYAGLIPFTVRRVVRQIDFDLHQQTLSFLSNKTLYDKRYVRGYTRLLFATAILHYVFFWLLSMCYNLGEHETYMRYINYSFAFFTLLAFVPHNIRPYSFKRFGIPCNVWYTTSWRSLFFFRSHSNHPVPDSSNSRHAFHGDCRTDSYRWHIGPDSHLYHPSGTQWHQ